MEQFLFTWLSLLIVLPVQKFVSYLMYRHLKAQGLYPQHFNFLVTYEWAQKAFNGLHRLHRNNYSSLLVHSKGTKKRKGHENDF
jgi:hypothetical protein